LVKLREGLLGIDMGKTCFGVGQGYGQIGLAMNALLVKRGVLLRQTGAG